MGTLEELLDSIRMVNSYTDSPVVKAHITITYRFGELLEDSIEVKFDAYEYNDVVAMLFKTYNSDTVYELLYKLNLIEIGFINLDTMEAYNYRTFNCKDGTFIIDVEIKKEGN